MRNGLFHFPIQCAHAQTEFVFSHWMCACATVLFMACSGSCHFKSATDGSKIVYSMRPSQKKINVMHQLGCSNAEFFSVQIYCLYIKILYGRSIWVLITNFDTEVILNSTVNFSVPTLIVIDFYVQLGGVWNKNSYTPTIKNPDWKAIIWLKLIWLTTAT